MTPSIKLMLASALLLAASLLLPAAPAHAAALDTFGITSIGANHSDFGTAYGIGAWGYVTFSEDVPIRQTIEIYSFKWEGDEDDAAEKVDYLKRLTVSTGLRFFGDPPKMKKHDPFDAFLEGGITVSSDEIKLKANLSDKSETNFGGYVGVGAEAGVSDSVLVGIFVRYNAMDESYTSGHVYFGYNFSK